MLSKVNSMYKSIESLERDILNKIQQGDFNTALELLMDFVFRVYESKRATATVFGSERLDRLCLAIGESASPLVRVPADVEINDADMVIIASDFGRYGGHTLVVEDLIRALPGEKHVILLTDLFNNMDAVGIRKRFGPFAEVRIAPTGNALTKLQWLMMQLNAIKSSKIFLFNHHQDAPAIASIQPSIRSKVFFYHHADHNLCLGVHLPGVSHIDCHNIGYYNCRLHERLKDNVYLPLSVDDGGVRSGHLEFMRDGQLRSCSCGTHIKFDPLYTYPYAELISKRLARFSGVHYHIGALPNDVLVSIRNQLKAAGVDTSRLVHIPWVPSLWSALIENEIDLFIGSFPLGGGRASIEAMGAGIPILAHVSSLSRFHGASDIVYPESFIWKDPSEFESCISSLTPQILADHSKHARQYFENNHTHKIMTAELMMICRGEGKLLPPMIRSYSPDYLQRHLQLTSFEDEQIAAMLSSSSWRVTAPFRYLMCRIRRIRQS